MGGSSSATGRRPRVDGVYACPVYGATGAPGWNYLRFHADGRVTAAWAGADPEAAAGDLTPDREDLDQGYLTFDDPVFGFSTVSRNGQGEWAGFVNEDGTLFVRSVSQITGETLDETYGFHRLA
jgi:hypothetical protein